jgi:hypothetical protein
MKNQKNRFCTVSNARKGVKINEEQGDHYE